MSAIPYTTSTTIPRRRSKARTRSFESLLKLGFQCVAVFFVTVAVATLLGYVAMEQTRQDLRRMSDRAASARKAVFHMQGAMAAFTGPQEMDEWARARGFVDTYPAPAPSSPKGYVAFNQ